MQKTDFKNFFWNPLFFENRKIEILKIENLKSGLGWVEFGNPKSGQNGVIFEIGPIGKTV